MAHARHSLTTTQTIAAMGSSLHRWTMSEPLAAFLAATILGSLVYFFGIVPLFKGGLQSVSEWAWTAWNPKGTQGHSRMVPFISLFLIWYHREEISRAPKKGSNLGLLSVAAGVLLFLLSVRCLQPRMALLSIPFLIYGSVVFLWGTHVARSFLFPCAFLVFLVPFEVIEQATFRLQFIITYFVGLISNVAGISLNAVGTTLTAGDGSFNFEIAEGCSGIRSLTAIAMLSSVYVHLTQDRTWKKLLIFGFSAIFAIVGNVGRLVTVMLVAKFINPEWAGTIYHDYSGYLFFPIAVGAMLLFGKLLNAGRSEPVKMPVAVPHPQ